MPRKFRFFLLYFKHVCYYKTRLKSLGNDLIERFISMKKQLIILTSLLMIPLAVWGLTLLSTPKTNKSLPLVSTAQSSEEASPLRLELIRVDDTRIHFLLINDSTVTYSHIMTDKKLDVLIGEAWQETAKLKTANYMAAPISAKSSSEFSVPLPEKQYQRRPLRLTLHLIDDQGNNTYLKCQFEL